MNYRIQMINDQNHTVKIWYRTVKTSRDGMFYLLRYLRSDAAGSLVEKEGKYYITFEGDMLECSWEKELGMKLHYLNLNPTRTRWTQGLERILDELNRQAVRTALEQANGFIDQMSWFDFMVKEYNGQDLSIVGSMDLSYYYQLEVIFEGVSYLKISSDWHTSPSEETVFRLADRQDPQVVNDVSQELLNRSAAVIVTIKPEDSEQYFWVVCDGVTVNQELVKYDQSIPDELADKDKVIRKYRLRKEGDNWYQQAENAHKALIFKDHFLKQNDMLGLIFRIHKLCFGKLKYFRRNIHKFQPCKHHFQAGFIETALWDSEFLRHRDSGILIDYRYLQSLRRYSDFQEFCEVLESYEQGAGQRLCGIDETKSGSEK